MFSKVPATATEILIQFGDWNGHVGSSVGVFSDTHGGHGFGFRHREGERILDFAIANGFRVSNIRLKKETHT